MKALKIFLSPAIFVAASAALASIADAQSTDVTLRSPLAATAPTAVPALIPYTGAITSDTKAAEARITFLIYKDEQGGEPLFTESQSVAVDPTGNFKAQLGATLPSGIPVELFSTGEARWLEVQVAGEKPRPRVLLSSVPYSLKAADSATLGGLPASAFALAGTATRNIADTSAGVTPDASATVTTPGGTSGYVPVFTGAAGIADSTIFQTTTGVGIGTATPAQTLDVKGPTVFRGNVNISRNGNATPTAGVKSFPIIISAQGYNSSTKAVVNTNFQLLVEPTGNNTASPASTLNLVYSNPTTVETGLYFNPNGTIHFAPGQTFPGTGTGTGNGTITDVTAGTGLTGGGTSGKVTLNVDTGKVPLLATSNTFVADQTITGNALISGNIGIGTAYPEGNIDIESSNSGQPLLINAASSGAWAINSFGGPNGGLSGRFVGGGGTSGNAAGGAIAAGGGSTSDSGPGGVGGAFYGGSSYSGQSGDGIDADGNSYGGGAPGLAGHFTGNVVVTGSLTNAVGTYQIDHPLDPANKLLNHASTASSEMMNIYSGNVVTDGSGTAIVALPEWLESVNGDFRYQLTVVGQFAQAIVSKEIDNHQFTISSSVPGVKVSWMVTAVRKDAYAQTHPLVVEETKNARERGFYVHPELYGQPEEKQTEWGRHPEQMQQMKALRENPKQIRRLKALAEVRNNPPK
jgi:hypothetical protein